MSKYDDLDDFLDDFEEQDRVLGPAAASEAPQTKPPVAAAAGGSSATGTAAGSTAGTSGAAEAATEPAAADLGGLEDEFAQKLSLGMDELSKQLESDPAAKAELEALMASLGVKSEPATSKAAPTKAASFEDTISQTVNRLNDSKQSADDKLGADDDFLEQMLSELAGAAAGGEGGMDSLLATLMQELSSKDVLYEPIKELHTKYPAWLEANASKLEVAELERYKHQQSIISEIVAKFEDPKYSDEDERCRSFVADKMAEMQESGSPPEEIVGTMAEGVPGLGGAGLGGAGLGGPAGDTGGCPVQ